MVAAQTRCMRRNSRSLLHSTWRREMCTERNIATANRRLFLSGALPKCRRYILNAQRQFTHDARPIHSCDAWALHDPPKRTVLLTEMGGTQPETRALREIELSFWLSPDAEHVLLVDRVSDPPDDWDLQVASQVVENDRKADPSIDTIYLDYSDMFTLFDGLQPKHLVARADDWGRLYFENYSELNRPWPLKSLWIICQEAKDTTVKNADVPSLYESLTSLGLYRCTRVGFPPSAPFKQLQQVQIFEYDACTMFADLALNCLEHPDKLRIVKLHDWEHSGWFSQCSGLLQALRRCSSMEVLELKCNSSIEAMGSATGEQLLLPKLLPLTLQHLRLRVLPSMASQMPTWIECAADPSWLPQLKTISFRLDADKSPSRSFEDEDNPPVPYIVMPDVEAFLSALKTSHPAVGIDQSWSGVTPGPLE
ncbi:hypothetical protein BDN72DRAFT_170209 [Pluteus cervinus]|uniref:Uncharacterized protein n=1 Tax=Pluteus cervinus TaxID=181527 RepID=A0ACD3AK12_9AGAR|nr:hypothetical protein BDN72DRAFT_170209 [Pluteus cervinus]